MRRHLLVKLLHSAGPEYRDRLHQMLRTLGPSESIKQLQAAVRSLRDDGVNLDGEMSDMSLCARICVLYMASNPDILLEPHNAPWSSLLDNDSQVRLFHRMLVGLLEKKTSKLFVTPVKKLSLIHI